MKTPKVGGNKGNAGKGRPKGSPNKATREFRETVQQLLDANRAKVQVWLRQVAEGHGDIKADPGKALDLMAKLAEFAAPKLQRTELVGDPEQPIETVFRWASEK